MKTKGNAKILPIVVGIILVIIIVFIATIGIKNTPVPKVGFIMTGSIEDSGWNGMHYQGVKWACDELGTELLVKENILEGTGECEQAIRELVSDGATLIILSSYSYPLEVKAVIEEYSDISFYTTSAEYYTDNMTSYFGRMYQVRYLAGIIAGMQTQNNQIGYVAAMQNIEVNRGINAFALGVKKVNPEAQIHVIWTGSWDNQQEEEQAADILINEVGVDMITYHQNQHYVAKVADAAGIYSIGYNEVITGMSDKYLTAAVFDWNVFYYEIIKEFCQGRANSVKMHWYGLDEAVIRLSDFSPAVSEETRRIVEEERQRLMSGQTVFSGEIYDNRGILRCAEGENISDHILLEKMDWYVDGVNIYEGTKEY